VQPPKERREDSACSEEKVGSSFRHDIVRQVAEGGKKRVSFYLVHPLPLGKKTTGRRGAAREKGQAVRGSAYCVRIQGKKSNRREEKSAANREEKKIAHRPNRKTPFLYATGRVKQPTSLPRGEGKKRRLRQASSREEREKKGHYCSKGKNILCY